MVRSPLTNASTYEHLFVFVSREILFLLFTLFFIFSVFLNISHLANTGKCKKSRGGRKLVLDGTMKIACLSKQTLQKLYFELAPALLSDVTSKIYQNNGECFMFLRHISNE